MEEVYQASAVGVFRTVLIIVFIVVVLRIVGKIIVARRNIHEHHNIQAKHAREKKAQEESRKNRGKITISDQQDSGDFTDYEEL